MCSVLAEGARLFYDMVIAGWSIEEESLGINNDIDGCFSESSQNEA